MITLIGAILGILVQIKNLLPASILSMLGGSSSSSQVATAQRAVDGISATQFYNPSSVYCLTPVAEETARAVARTSRPEPAHRWELEAPLDETDPVHPF